MNNPSNYISRPLDNIIYATSITSRGISFGIESYGVCDYVFQSLFLRLTGALEQKMKGICWEMASYDTEFRHKYFQELSKLGEMSTYDSKKFVYNNLIKQILQEDSSFSVETFIKHTEILNKCKQVVNESFSDTVLARWNQSRFDNFDHCFSKIKPDWFGNKELLNSWLHEVYERLYAHRNRCAHNTFSTHQNLPTLTQIADKMYEYENYFFWFALLLLIDYTFMSLYEEYQSHLNFVTLQ